MSTPLTNPPGVVFAEATPAQRTLTWELNGASWAPPLTIAQYLTRELTLSTTALSANRGTRYYILHAASSPSTILSACEVTSKRALVKSSAAAGDGAVREVRAYAIASVFTAPEHRGRGLAGYLLRCVQREVDGEGGAECGVLYSDIGRVFYTKLGWKDYRSAQVALKLEEGFGDVLAAAGRGGGEPEVVMVTEGEVEELCARDEARQRERLEGLVVGEGETHVAFVPESRQMAWHFARDGYVAGVMRDGREVVNRGARTADGASWLYWDHDLREKKLKVLRIVVTATDGKTAVSHVKALLRAALAEARDWDLPKVLVWSPGSDVCVAATELWQEARDKLQVVFDERQDGSIPSLRWRDGKDAGTVVWEDNEYFAWC